MIQSQFGSELTITEFDKKTQLVAAIRKSDGARRLYPVWSLKADGGVDELQKACDEAKEASLDMVMGQ